MLRGGRGHTFGTVVPTEKPKKKRQHPEADLQKSVVADMRKSGEWVVYVENEGKRTPQQAARWRAMGGAKGCPDVLLPLRRIAIEFKAPGGKLTPEQENAHEAMRAHGWEVIVARHRSDVPSYLLNGQANQIRVATADTGIRAGDAIEIVGGKARRLGRSLTQVAQEQRRPSAAIIGSGYEGASQAQDEEPCPCDDVRDGQYVWCGRRFFTAECGLCSNRDCPGGLACPSR